jgi:divalent metal cation (Fe/Co/Zn/Cd) transporter
MALAMLTIAVRPADEDHAFGHGKAEYFSSGVEGDGIEFHAVRTRRAGTQRFVSFHVLVPGEWTVQRGHDLLEAIESEVGAALPNATVLPHLEPVEDPSSWDDVHLDRGTPNSKGGPR